MSEFTRLTVIGSTRRAELVVPNDESVGGLIPRLMELLGERSGSVARPLTLVRSTGEQLEAGLSAAEQQIRDGELLRLVRQDDAPPPPEVADVTDVLAGSHDERAGRWSATTRQVVGAVAIGALAWGAVTAAVGVPAAVLLVGYLAAAVVALIVGRLGFRWLGIGLTAAAAGAATPVSLRLLALPAVTALVPAADRVALTQPTPPGSFPAIAIELALPAAVGMVWIALGLGLGAGLGRRAVQVAAGIGLVLCVLPLVLLTFGLPPTSAIAVTGVVSVVLCGLLPWYAMSTSGLTGLDDQVLAGQPRRRTTVLKTADEAYRSLSWATFAVALPLAATSSILVSSENNWAAGLGGLLLLITALRTRAFPLAVQQAPLWFAAGLGALVGLSTQHRINTDQTAASLLVLVVVVLVLVGARPATHQRARLRRYGNLLEALAVVALVPVLLGVFGIYADLVKAF